MRLHVAESQSNWMPLVEPFVFPDKFQIAEVLAEEK